MKRAISISHALGHLQTYDEIIARTVQTFCRKRAEFSDKLNYILL
jgi:hypothetical protein